MKIQTLISNQAAIIRPLQSQTPSRNWSLSETKELLSSVWVQGFGLFNDETLIGICILRVIEDEVEILELAIDHAHRQKGFAQKLWDHIQGAHAKATFFLEVAEHNNPAIKFYEKIGFTQIHRRDNYYGAGNHALIYTIRPDRK
tara:strand:+ start:7645 stop:8076 length:432 start_codon:yes stop_codon:yes gene_type:complete